MQEGGCRIPGLSWKNRIPIDKSITLSIRDWSLSTGGGGWAGKICLSGDGFLLTLP